MFVRDVLRSHSHIVHPRLRTRLSPGVHPVQWSQSANRIQKVGAAGTVCMLTYVHTPWNSQIWCIWPPAEHYEIVKWRVVTLKQTQKSRIMIHECGVQFMNIVPLQGMHLPWGHSPCRLCPPPPPAPPPFLSSPLLPVSEQPFSLTHSSLHLAHLPRSFAMPPVWPTPLEWDVGEPWQEDYL